MGGASEFIVFFPFADFLGNESVLREFVGCRKDRTARVRSHVVLGSLSGRKVLIGLGHILKDSNPGRDLVAGASGSDLGRAKNTLLLLLLLPRSLQIAQP